MGANEWRSDGRLPEEGRVGLRRAWMFGGGGQLDEGGNCRLTKVLACGCCAVPVNSANGAILNFF